MLLISCTSEEEVVHYSSVCGDRLCSGDEIGHCDIDCQAAEEPVDTPVTVTPADVMADLRARQRNYSPEEISETGTTGTANPVSEDDELIDGASFEDYIPSVGFRVMGRYNLLGIGENISGVMGTLTGMQMREVLRGGRIASNTQAFGPRVALYEQLLTLRSGKVVFGYDEESEKATTYLEFKEGDVIFDYLLRLSGGIFKFFEGESIDFLGHKYVIVEATNSSLKLEGLSTPDSILFRNQHGALINEKSKSMERLNITLGKDYLRVIILADEPLKVLPGQKLTDVIWDRESLMTNRLDLEYVGLTDSPVIETSIERRSEKYKLEFVNNINISYSLDLAWLPSFKIGGEDYGLVYKEGSGSTDYNIEKDDYLIINNNRELGGITNIIRLGRINYEEELVAFEDPALEKFYVYFRGTPGTNASGELIIYNVKHNFFVGPNNTLSIDLNGDGSINGGKASIITAGNGILKINNEVNNYINMSFVTPKQLVENGKKDIITNFLVKDYGIEINEESLVMQEDSDRLLGLNEYGTIFVLKSDADSDTQSGEDLIIINPVYQRFADVVVKAYE